MRRRFFIHNLVLLTLPVVLVVLLLGFMALYITMDSTSKSIQSINEQTTDRIQESTELIFNEADAQSLNYSVSPYVMLRLEALLKNGYSDKPDLDVSYMISTFLDSNVNSKAYLHSIYLYLNNENGNFFASSVGLANSLNYNDIGWMEENRATPQDIKQWLEIREVSTYARSSFSSKVLSLNKRWYRSGKEPSFGMIVINIRLDYLQNFYKNYRVYPEQSILLLKEDGTVLCGAGELANRFSDLTMQELEKEYFVSKKGDSAFGVAYYSFIPKSILTRQAQEMIRIVIFSILLSLLLGGILAYFITRRNVHNIDNILILLESAENGKEIPEIKNTGNVYGFIMQNIVKTFLHKNSLDMQLIEKKYKLEKMHFSFLQSQLNPHFLFNTLKNIFWKTIKLTGEPNDASHMIDLLTSLLHYALVNHDRTVPLEEELENTRQYIQIQQMRFDNHFKVDWNCSSDLTQARCIKFLLQPLVENSISHGLAEVEAGRICISVRSSEERLSFSVSDNGCGFTPERLKAIQVRLSEDDSPAEGIGLYNLNKRLTLAYGSQAALSIKSVPGEETTISFSFNTSGLASL